MYSLKPKPLINELILDTLTLIIAFLISLYFLKDASFTIIELIVLSCLTAFCFLKLYFKNVQTATKINGNNRRFLNRIILYLVFSTLLILSYNLIRGKWHAESVIAIITGAMIVDFMISYLMFELVLIRSFNNEQLKNILVAGTGRAAKNVESELIQQTAGVRLKGFINCNNNDECTVGKDRILGDLSNINQYLYANNVDEIVIALPSTQTTEIQNVVRVADFHGVRVKYILDYHEIFGDRYKITRLGHIDALDVHQVPGDDRVAAMSKSCFDKVFASFALLMLSPMLLVIALVIKLDSPGPVIYCPIRVGRNGKPFRLFKFRTMLQNDVTSGGTLSTKENDPRVTRIGRVLRKYSLDELPQFVNVLLGNMSVVGPRPHRGFLDRQLQDSVVNYMIRHYVKPGITGWAQVNGWRGPTDTEEQRKQRTSYDLWYIDNWSFMLDLKIIFLTIFSKKAHKAAF